MPICQEGETRNCISLLRPYIKSRREECLIAKHTLCKKKAGWGLQNGISLFILTPRYIYIGSFRRRRIFGLAGKRYKHCGAERHNRSNFNDFICFCLIFQIVFMEKCLNSKQIHAKPPFPKFVEMSLKILWKTGNKWPAAYPPPLIKTESLLQSASYAVHTPSGALFFSE